MSNTRHYSKRGPLRFRATRKRENNPTLHATSMFPVPDDPNQAVDTGTSTSGDSRSSNRLRGFSQLNTGSRWAEIDTSPAGAKEWLRETIRQMGDITRRSFERRELLPQHSLMLNRVLGAQRGAPCTMLASNLHQRSQCGAALIDFMDVHRRQTPERRYFLVTIFSDRWLSFDRAHTIIWLGGMKKIIAEVMRHAGFEGWFGAVEIQTLDETTGGLGRALLPHFHAIGWTTDRNFDPDAAAVRMQRLGRLKSHNNAQTVVITGDDGSSPSNLAAYILKAPSLAKAREPCASSPSGFRFTKTALPPIAAARLTEVLSGIYFDELLLSGGNGKGIRTHLRRLVRSSISDRSHHNISIEQAQRFWTELRRQGPLKRYPAVKVERTFGQLDLHSPICLASAPWNVRRVVLFAGLQRIEVAARQQNLT